MNIRVITISFLIILSLTGYSSSLVANNYPEISKCKKDNPTGVMKKLKIYLNKFRLPKVCKNYEQYNTNSINNIFRYCVCLDKDIGINFSGDEQKKTMSLIKKQILSEQHLFYIEEKKDTLGALIFLSAALNIKLTDECDLNIDNQLNRLNKIMTNENLTTITNIKDIQKNAIKTCSIDDQKCSIIEGKTITLLKESSREEIDKILKDLYDKEAYTSDYSINTLKDDLKKNIDPDNKDSIQDSFITIFSQDNKINQFKKFIQHMKGDLKTNLPKYIDNTCKKLQDEIGGLNTNKISIEEFLDIAKQEISDDHLRNKLVCSEITKLFLVNKKCRNALLDPLRKQVTKEKSKITKAEKEVQSFVKIINQNNIKNKNIAASNILTCDMIERPSVIDVKELQTIKSNQSNDVNNKASHSSSSADRMMQNFQKILSAKKREIDSSNTIPKNLIAPTQITPEAVHRSLDTIREQIAKESNRVASSMKNITPTSSRDDQGKYPAIEPHSKLPTTEVIKNIKEQIKTTENKLDQLQDKGETDNPKNPSSNDLKTSETINELKKTIQQLTDSVKQLEKDNKRLNKILEDKKTVNKGSQSSNKIPMQNNRHSFTYQPSKKSEYYNPSTQYRPTNKIENRSPTDPKKDDTGPSKTSKKTRPKQKNTTSTSQTDILKDKELPISESLTLIKINYENKQDQIYFIKDGQLNLKAINDNNYNDPILMIEVKKNGVTTLYTLIKDDRIGRGNAHYKIIDKKIEDKKTINSLPQSKESQKYHHKNLKSKLPTL